VALSYRWKAESGKGRLGKDRGLVLRKGTKNDNTLGNFRFIIEDERKMAAHFRSRRLWKRGFNLLGDRSKPACRQGGRDFGRVKGGGVKLTSETAIPAPEEKRLSLSNERGQTIDEETQGVPGSKRICH